MTFVCQINENNFTLIVLQRNDVQGQLISQSFYNFKILYNTANLEKVFENSLNTFSLLLSTEKSVAPFIKVSSVSRSWVQFKTIVWVMVVALLLFFVCVEWANQWAGSGSFAPSNSSVSYVEMTVSLAVCSTLAFPCESASVVAVPVKSFINVTVVLVGSILPVFLPSCFFSFWVLISKVFWESKCILMMSMCTILLA